MKLYEVREEYLYKLEALFGIEGIEQIPQEVINDSLESIQGPVNEKFLSIAAYIKNMQLEVRAMEEYIKRMQNKKDIFKKKIDSGFSFLEGNMRLLGLDKKIEGTELTISFRKNSCKVNIIDPEIIPEYFKKIKVEFMKDDIKRAIKDGYVIPGAELINAETLSISEPRLKKEKEGDDE